MSDQNPPTVLVVDDDDDLRGSLCATLEDAGYAVTSANDGEHALRQMEKGTPDLLLLDLMMPNGSGWDVLEALRSAPKEPPVPVVIISAYASSPPDGARTLIKKPVSRNHLL